MGITETSIIYSIIGAVVASAMWLATPAEHGLVRGSRFVLHTVFWPFFAPLLLGRSLEVDSSSARDRPTSTDGDDPRVNQAQQRLLDALASLDGIAEDVLGSQMDHVRHLTGSLAAMARRIGEMDELLATSEFDAARAQLALDAICQPAEHERSEPNQIKQADADLRARRDSVRARLRNIRRLQQMRQASSADLERAILEIEEISSRIRLLRFADRPENEVSGLIQDIAATVEGLSEGLLSTP